MTDTIAINRKFFEDYFEKPLQESLNEGNIDDSYTKLKKIIKNYNYLINRIEEKPTFFTILLLHLLQTYKEIDETVVQMQFKFVNKIFKGVYELAKNIKDHSEHQEGWLSIETLSYKVLLNRNKENKQLWKDYFTGVKGSTRRTYLNISIADAGTVGIIETSLTKNDRNIPGKIIDPDIERINKLIEKCGGEEKKEAQLLFDMYFGGNNLKLLRQANNAYKGLGISLFTKCIKDNTGIFNVQTNKYRDGEKTISFSYSGNSENLKSAFSHPENIGTRYNIIFPIQQKTENNEIREDTPITSKELEAPSRVVYEQMFLMEPRDAENYFLGELDSHRLFKQVIGFKESENRKDEILVFSLKSKQEKPDMQLPTIDASSVFRVISGLFADNKDNNLKAIVVKDTKQDLITDLFDIFEYYAPQKTLTDTSNCFFLDGKMVLILTEEQPDLIRNGSVITGSTADDCRRINKYIDGRNGYFKVLSEIQSTTTENCSDSIKTDINNHILFPSGQLIILDYFEKGDTYFEEKAKVKLENLIDNDGYQWKRTHLKIGSKLHLDDFVYGKKMFQRSVEVSGFAFSIARSIFNNIKKGVDTSNKKTVYTLVGYGFYSELLVSRTREFIKYLMSLDNITEDEADVEYVIIKDEEKIKFSRYIHNFQIRKHKNMLEKIIIIVPISSTLTTCLKIENAFYKELEEKRKEEKAGKNEYREDRFKVEPRFYTTIVVGDRIDVEAIPKTIPEQTAEDSFDAIRKCWKGADAVNKIIYTENREVKDKKGEAIRENQYNIYIQSTWQLPENCVHCFPKKPIQERPLFITDKVSVTPSLIFDCPKWYEIEESDTYKPYFKLDKDNTSLEEISLPIINKIDWVHYTGDSNKHFNYYLHYLDFIKDNEKKLRYKDEPENWAKIIRDKLAEEREGQVLLIAPDKSENGAFVHLINREIFDDRAEIIRFDKHSDHYLNFDKFFKDKIRLTKTIYFVDNLMSSGKTFLSVDEILKISQEEMNTDGQKKGDIKRIKGVFCLINRMDYSCYHTVVCRLEENNKDKGKNSLYSFINLNVPESVVIPCPMCDEKKKYEGDEKTKEMGLKDSVSLDCIKQYFVEKEIPYFKDVDKEDLTEGKLPYEPLSKNHSSTLLKVAFIHFLNKAFAENPTHDEWIKQLKTGELPDWDNKDMYPKYLDFNLFADNFRDYISQQKQCCIKGKDKKDKDEIINDLKFKANLIKVLSSQSFKKYRGVYISVFYWVLCELIVVARTILGKDYDFKGTYDVLKEKENTDRLTDFSILAESNTDFTTRKKIDLYIDTANYLRMLVKYASSLNIAYLLHKDFLAAINNFINRKDEITKKIQDNKHLKAKDRDEVRNKYEEMRYSFQNFKLFCAAHIVRSLHKNEQRAIQFEKNINFLYNKLKGEDTTFLELLTLENTSIIRQTLDNIENVSGLEPKDPRLDDFFAFWEVKKEDRNLENEKFKNLKYAHEIRKKIKNYEKNGEDNTTVYDNDEEINGIINNIAKMVGCNKTGGGILLYKYQHLKGDNEFENYRVLGKYGEDPTLADYFGSSQTNSFSIKFLEGITYLIEKSVINKSTEYKWTNYAIHKNKDHLWVGQDGEHIISTDIQKITGIANRILLIRISSYHEQKNKKENEPKEKLTGEAVFVFYDNDCKYNEEGIAVKPDSVHDTRFVHVLRNEISEHLKKKYHNDAFRAWVEVKNKKDYSFSIKHGVARYVESLEKNIAKLPDGDEMKEDINCLFKFLINKINLLSAMTKDKILPDKQPVNVSYLIDKIKTDYKVVFSFFMDDILRIEKSEMNNYVADIDDSKPNIQKYKNETIDLPKTFCDELVFEILINIRRHAIALRKNNSIRPLGETNKLTISVNVEEKDSILYLSIQNSHSENAIHTHPDKNHGCDLINNVLLKIGLPKSIKSIEENYAFKILIPIKKLSK